MTDRCSSHSNALPLQSEESQQIFNKDFRFLTSSFGSLKLLQRGRLSNSDCQQWLQRSETISGSLLQSGFTENHAPSPQLSAHTAAIMETQKTTSIINEHVLVGPFFIFQK